jgi:uncharacterized protein YhhL (DUF1145 family)
MNFALVDHRIDRYPISFAYHSRGHLFWSFKTGISSSAPPFLYHVRDCLWRATGAVMEWLWQANRNVFIVWPTCSPHRNNVMWIPYQYPDGIAQPLIIVFQNHWLTILYRFSAQAASWLVMPCLYPTKRFFLSHFISFRRFRVASLWKFVFAESVVPDSRMFNQLTQVVIVTVILIVTLRLVIYRQSVRLGDKPLETHDTVILFFNRTLAVIVLM